MIMIAAVSFAIGFLAAVAGRGIYGMQRHTHTWSDWTSWRQGVTWDGLRVITRVRVCLVCYEEDRPSFGSHKCYNNGDEVCSHYSELLSLVDNDEKIKQLEKELKIRGVQ